MHPSPGGEKADPSSRRNPSLPPSSFNLQSRHSLPFLVVCQCGSLMQASGSVPPTPQGSTSSSSSSRPTQTYVTILKDVLGDEELSLSLIYEKISEKYPYFEASEAGWKNTVRHTLSLNPTFINVPRPYPASGKGGLWKIDPSAPETYTRKRDKKKKKKAVGPLTTTSPQPGAERGAKRTRSSTTDTGGGAWIVPSSTANDEEAAVVVGPGEDEDAEGTDKEEEWDEDDGVAVGAAVLTGLMEAGMKGGGQGGEISPALRLPQLSVAEYSSGGGEGGGRTSQPSYRSGEASSSHSSSWSTSQATPGSSEGYRHPHQHHNDYPASYLNTSPRSHQRRDSATYSAASSSSYPSSHHHASSSNSYFPPSGPSSTPSYTHYQQSNQVGAPFSAYTGHPGGGPPRHSYSNPTLLPSNPVSSAYQLPPLNPQAQQQPYPVQLPPPPSIPPFSAMHIQEPSPRHFHVEGGWDRSPEAGHSRIAGRRESAERGGGGLGGGGRVEEERFEQQQQGGGTGGSGEGGRNWTDD